MANPLKVLRGLLRLRAEDRDAALLEPEAVGGGLAAVRELLGEGLPEKDSFVDDASGAKALSDLAGFYRPHGRAVKEGGTSATAPVGAGDRLYRDDIAHLAQGLDDLAERAALATSLRQRRREAGYSLRELARFAGVHHSYLSRIERAAVPRPSDGIMGRLSAPLGLPAPEGAASPEGSPDLAGLGLHRAAVRSLLKMVRDLPDEHLELLAAQARTMLDLDRRRRKPEGPDSPGRSGRVGSPGRTDSATKTEAAGDGE